MVLRPPFTMHRPSRHHHAQLLRRTALLAGAFLTVCGLRADVLVVGEALAREAAFAARLAASGLKSVAAKPAALAEIDPSHIDAVILAPETALPHESRLSLQRYLRSGGRLAIVGTGCFDSEPRPASAVVVSRFDDASAVRIREQPRKVTNPEPLVRTTLQGPDGRPALGFATRTTGMENFLVEIDAAAARAPDRTVLRFWAKGDSYMDLLTVVIEDSSGRAWRGFVRLANGEWRQHALSLADCIPEGWKKPGDPYPLVAPAEIARIGLGVHRGTVWTEKPMSFALGTVELAKDERQQYAPTAALSELGIPFKEAGIQAPDWTFDPFFRSTSLPVGSHLQIATTDQPALSSASPSVAAPPGARLCPTPFVEHQGVAMGTDHKKDYMRKFERETRRVPVWTVVSSEGIAVGAVAELRYAASGPLGGSAQLLCGVPVAALLADRTLLGSFCDAVVRLTKAPVVASVTPQAAPSSDGRSARPELQVVVQNPGRSRMEGTVRVAVAKGRLRGEGRVAIPARGSATARIALPDVDAAFPFSCFDWEVRLETSSGNDRLADIADVERALLHALRHMASTQAIFPDGRISHHYFGDAYGVRAMYAYLDLLKREPARLERHADLRRALPAEAIERCANRFFDMLAARQTPKGEVPMGYGENTPVYNVADCGQMALSVGQVIPLIADEARKARYLDFCKRFASWAETFYIDEAFSAELTRKMPDKARETKAGHYGLGSRRGIRTPNGPSWVMPDVLGAQIALASLAPGEGYDRIARRNWRAYLDAKYPSTGYFQAEALFWSWLATDDAGDRSRIEESLRDGFLADRVKGDIHEMYERGARSNLNALPLLYHRRLLEDTATVRALLLKYVWAFASEDAPNAMRRVAETFPKPGHGESIAAVKQASTGALWAIELLDPGASLLRDARFQARLRAK